MKHRLRNMIYSSLERTIAFLLLFSSNFIYVAQATNKSYNDCNNDHKKVSAIAYYLIEQKIHIDFNLIQR